MVSGFAPTGKQRVKGFTIPELMVVIAIMAVMMGFAVPGLRDLMGSQKVKSASFDLITSAMFARSEAVKRGAVVTIKAATPDDLATGWCAIFGTAADCDLAAPEPETMRVQTPYPTVTFDWKTTAGPIAFGTTGRINALVTIEITDNANTAFKRCVNIDVTGIPNSRSGAC